MRIIEQYIPHHTAEAGLGKLDPRVMIAKANWPFVSSSRPPFIVKLYDLQNSLLILVVLET